MKKVAYYTLALIALIGLLNCSLIEPAFACKESLSHSTASDDLDCCFIHCSIHHQYVSASSSEFPATTNQSNPFVSLHLDLHSDPALGSIFHPPLAF